MDGEAKKEMYNLLPKHLYPATFTVLPGQHFDLLKKELQAYILQQVSLLNFVKSEW